MLGCIPFISAQIDHIIPSCTAALDNFTHIQQAEDQGKPPSPADQSNLLSNSYKCLSESTREGLRIPVECNRCLGVPPSTPS
ncbi:hypothetical protein Agabi119p4_10406 [Agaricus bisporus var. burnettii]|uniref:Uncharacterized protein n=1 Tax=Agaricus bisporus var. burnettii TaxID=192524 RepID=A0A8H7C1Z1_AGABI|nr:hypothetical protein Agabi119p4_10406 [Agaricus bisporus var. burnettii]